MAALGVVGCEILEWESISFMVGLLNSRGGLHKVKEGSSVLGEAICKNNYLDLVLI